MYKTSKQLILQSVWFHVLLRHLLFLLDKTQMPHNTEWKSILLQCSSETASQTDTNNI